MNETGSHDVFSETNGVEIENRESTCQNGMKCIECVLATEGTLSKVTGSELIECSEIVDYHHRGCLTDIDFSEHFAEEFVEGDERKVRCLHPNRKSHHENFAEKFDQILDNINIEKELQEVNCNFSRAKLNNQMQTQHMHYEKLENMWKVE